MAVPAVVFSYEGQTVTLANTGSGSGGFAAEPPEGSVSQGESAGVQKILWQYKSNSSAATPFSISLGGPFTELGIKSLPVVVFYNNRESITALSLNAKWKLGTEPDKIVIEFPSHAPAPLKIGELLTIVTFF